MKYAKVEHEVGEFSDWYRPRMSGYRMACCDCGLVHDVEFRVSEDGAVEMRVKRNERATGAKRRTRREAA